MRQSWTDERPDDSNRSVAERFDHVDRRFDQVDRRLEQMEKRFEHVYREVQAMRSEMHMRFDSAQKTTVHAILAMTAAMIAGYAAVIGLFATQV